MQITELLQHVGLSKKHAEVFVLLYTYGAKPASVIARMLGEERTNTYKILQTLVREGFVAENEKWSVKHFFIANKEVLRNKIEEQRKTIEEQEKFLPQIEQKLSELDREHISPIPKMRFFEWTEGMLGLFKDILRETRERKYSTIKCIASNTLESLSITNKNLEAYTGDFFEELGKNGIKIESYLWTGVLTLEQMMKSYDPVDIRKLSVGNNSLNFFIVGEIIYFIIFKQIPFGIKIESSEFADLMHFMLKRM